MVLSARYFRQLDLIFGFHQIEIEEEDRHKTAFRDADELPFELTRSAFGLTILPAAFSRRVKAVICSLDGVHSWLDDVLIVSVSMILALLTMILQRLTTAGCSVNRYHTHL